MNFQHPDLPFTINSETLHPVDGGFIAQASLLKVTMREAPQRYLTSGWQSWSLTAWMDVKHPHRPQFPRRLHPMQLDPVYAQEKRPHGSWYGAVEWADGSILFTGSLSLGSHVMLSGKTLSGWYEQGTGDWFIAIGSEMQVFSQYASLLADRLGKGRNLAPQRVWCSWYSFYKEISEGRLLKVLEELGDLPFDVFQVDDGWQLAIGEWEANDRFPSGMGALARHIKDSGRKAGLWLAPLLAVPSSPVFKQHPEWFIRDERGTLVSAGYNWESPLFALDTTHPQALEWLTSLMKKVRAWGYDYIKLDFLYAGALPGVRHVTMPREDAYRHGLQAIRDALGDAFFLTCGAPILPSLGLCDGMRIGPDVSGRWNSIVDDTILENFTIPGVRNALRTTVNRLWLQPLVQADPDVVYFTSKMNSLTTSQMSLVQDLAEICKYKGCSDLPSWWTADDRETIRAFLLQDIPTTRLARNEFKIGMRQVDFSPHIFLPPRSGLLTRLIGSILNGVSQNHAIMKAYESLTGRLFKRNLEKRL